MLFAALWSAAPVAAAPVVRRYGGWAAPVVRRLRRWVGVVRHRWWWHWWGQVRGRGRYVIFVILIRVMMVVLDEVHNRNYESNIATNRSNY